MIDQQGLSEILKKYWGYGSFRPNQEDIIFSILDGRDTLAVLPTGGGKSVCFQVPALALEGTCLVISPLIALMRDQIDQLRMRGVSAAGLYSGLHQSEIELVLENFVNNHYKLLYISPERLQAESFKAYLRHAKISFVAVDEAHCISQWGYDFRPSYLKINTIREFFPDCSFLALTASATPRVQKDIQDKLEFGAKNIFQASFLRSNLSFSVFNLENKGQKMLEIFKAVAGSGIVYVQSRKSASIWSSWLIQNGLNSDYYHAGLSFKDRERKQKNWIGGKTRILVATNAFGMGIDKGDVRTVVHVEVPMHPEAYYQEAGRAGRDGFKAYAIALFTHQDLKDARKRLEFGFPGPDFIRSIYDKLGVYLKLAIGSGELASFDFEIEPFCKAFSLHQGQVYHAFRKLEIAGYLLLNDGFYQPSRFHFTVSNAGLYDAQVRNEKIEKVSKALLRLYGGELFSDFVGIKESEISVILKTTVEGVEKSLSELQSLGLAKYEIRSSHPQVTFLTTRLEAKNLDLDLELLMELKQNEINRLLTMEKYLTMEKGCRSAFLADYFGEPSPPDCGICDNCLQKKKKEKPLGFDYFKPIIMNDLLLPVPPKEYELKFRPSQREELRNTISYLLEEELVVFNEDGLLRLKA